MGELLADRTSPLVANYRMNAGYIPLDHWVHGPEGGGRNIGEACHVYDLFDFLTGAEETSVQAQAIGAENTALGRQRQLRRHDRLRRRLGLHAHLHRARPPRPSEGAARRLRRRPRPLARRLQVALRRRRRLRLDARRTSRRATSRSWRRSRARCARAARGRSRSSSSCRRRGSASPSNGPARRIAVSTEPPTQDHTVAVVVPVYRGEETLGPLLEELDGYTTPAGVVRGGNRFRVSEVVLVHDAGPDPLGRHHPELCRPVRLRPPRLARAQLRPARRDAGRHVEHERGLDRDDGRGWPARPRRDRRRCSTPPSPAALAARVRGADQRGLLTAPSATSTSRVAHRAASLVGAGDLTPLPQLSAGARRGGPRTGGLLRRERLPRCRPDLGRQPHGHVPGGDARRARPASGYSIRRLASHFWRMVLTSGTRPLRLVALFGAFLGLAAFALIGWVIWARITDDVAVQGWTSVMVILLVTERRDSASRSASSPSTSASRRGARWASPSTWCVSDPADGPLGRAAPDGPRRCPGSSDAPRHVEPVGTGRELTATQSLGRRARWAARPPCRDVPGDRAGSRLRDLASPEPDPLARHADEPSPTSSWRRRASSTQAARRAAVAPALVCRGRRGADVGRSARAGDRRADALPRQRGRSACRTIRTLAQRARCSSPRRRAASTRRAGAPAVRRDLAGGRPRSLRAREAAPGGAVHAACRRVRRRSPDRASLEPLRPRPEALEAPGPHRPRGSCGAAARAGVDLRSSRHDSRLPLRRGRRPHGCRRDRAPRATLAGTRRHRGRPRRSSPPRWRRRWHRFSAAWRQVLRRPLRVALAGSPAGRLQPRVLSFRSAIWPDLRRSAHAPSAGRRRGAARSAGAGCCPQASDDRRLRPLSGELYRRGRSGDRLCAHRRRLLCGAESRRPRRSLEPPSWCGRAGERARFRLRHRRDRRSRRSLFRRSGRRRRLERPARRRRSRRTPESSTSSTTAAPFPSRTTASISASPPASSTTSSRPSGREQRPSLHASCAQGASSSSTSTIR